MRICVVAMLIVFTGSLTSGCQSPGCIRHSQCKSGLECRDSKCQWPLTDAKAGTGGTSGVKAAAGTTGVSRGNGDVPNGSSGSSGSGTAGQSTPANPDAGMSP